MRLLVTRPEPESTALKAQLIGMGHEVLTEPLLHIDFQPLEDIDPDELQGLIATSRNAVRAVATSPSFDALQILPLYTVGPGTAAAARALGFQFVIEGPRDGRALIALIAIKAEVNAGPLVYLAGDVGAFDLGDELRRLGFHVLEPVVYTTQTADRLRPELCQRFAAGEIDGVLLFSPRTARTYARLVKKHKLSRALDGVTHYCLSAAVALQLADLPGLHIKNAHAPNLEEMLALIARTTPQFK